MQTEPRHFLRIEGLAVLVGALALYFTLDAPVWLLVVLALAPDLSMLGYLAGPKLGSLAYNIIHTYTLPLTLGGLGFWIDAQLAIHVAIIWAGHIGADRFFGYGLKYESGFKDTHLSTQPAPLEAFTDSE